MSGGSTCETDNEASFTALIVKIERYCADGCFELSNEVAGVTDIYDVSLSLKSKSMKCVLHPSLNYMISYGRVSTNSCVTVKRYTTIDLGDVTVRVLNEIKPLEYVHTSDCALASKHPFFHGKYSRDKPLLTSREYYLPLYNNEGVYGRIWSSLAKPMKSYNCSAFNNLINLDELKSKRNSCLPVYGTVITKSKLAHFGKNTDSKNKYPFIFSIEIEGNDKTCAVTFWNKVCLYYYNSIKVGQVIVLRNYRVKKRYNTRTNTVYSGSESIPIELSINPANPKGEVDLLDVASVYIPYRFISCSTFENSLYTSEFIMDTVGAITYIGRWERERKRNAASSSLISAGEFWMYKWVFLNDGTSQEDMKCKLYACSHAHVLDEFTLGDIFVGSRLLYKSQLVYNGRYFQRFYYFTSTRETQVNRISKDWCFDEIECYPFIKCKRVCDVLKHFSKDSASDGLNELQSACYFKFPPIPDSLLLYKESHDAETPYKERDVKEIKECLQSIHMHETIRDIIRGSVVAMELIKSQDILSGAVEIELPTIVINRQLMKDNISQQSKPHEYTLTNANYKRFLGNQLYEDKEFIQMIITDLNKEDYLVVLLTPSLSEEFIEKHPEINEKDEFVFVLDMFSYGNKQYEIVVHKTFSCEY